MTEPQDGRRARALAAIVDLARQNGLGADEIAAALGEAPPRPAGVTKRNVLVRVLGFVGGTFVFAGIGTFIALQWDDMSSAARVVVTLGSGLSAFALAAAFRHDRRFEAAITGFLIMAAVLEPTGMLVAFQEYGQGGDWRWAGLLTTGAVGGQFGLAIVSMRRSAVLFIFTAFAAAFFATALDLAGADETTIALVLGAALLLVAIRVDRTPHADVTPAWYFFGAIVFLAGLFDLVKRTPFEIGFLAAAIGFVYASAVLRSRALLVVATLAILAYTGWFTAEHFADSVGWPLALIGFGVFMIAMSAVAVRVDRRYVRAR